MLPIVLSAFLFLLLVTAISAYGYRTYVRPSRIYDRVGGMNESGPLVTETPKPAPRDIVVRVFEQIGQQIPMSPADQTTTRRDLMRAGFRSEGAIRIFSGMKVIFCVVAFVFALLLHRHVSANPVLRIVFLIAGTGAGYSAPGFYLEKLVKKRQLKLRLSMPDALDMMVVAVEAGLGLDQAMQYVAHEIETAHPDLADEIGLVGLEMRAGKRRSEALRNLAERTGEPELKKLVAILIQSDRFGTSMGDSLRTHSDFMRTRRKQEAEERAAKVGVKLVFPIFFFILPTMMIVSAGPALMRLVREFSHFGK